jgi:hypothetical protein
MTRKDYIAAAKIVRDPGYGYQERIIVRQAFEQLFANDNPRFNQARFQAACIPSKE